MDIPSDAARPSCLCHRNTFSESLYFVYGANYRFAPSWSYQMLKYSMKSFVCSTMSAGGYQVSGYQWVLRLLTTEQVT